ncbi:hypothetical protein BCV70DRAFT_208250 [Testicularia cyperi]|uniref:Nucleoporin NUP188 n=1 Tax=Testicularia cyperi TaxID=1882483 RepID=A0A317XJB1_9BASI|nr:hypothetical protein BCV70DRAFT_208250 [Testicularia cyperi]
MQRRIAEFGDANNAGQEGARIWDKMENWGHFCRETGAWTWLSGRLEEEQKGTRNSNQIEQKVGWLPPWQALPIGLAVRGHGVAVGNGNLSSTPGSAAKDGDVSAQPSIRKEPSTGYIRRLLTRSLPSRASSSLDRKKASCYCCVALEAGGKSLARLGSHLLNGVHAPVAGLVKHSGAMVGSFASSEAGPSNLGRAAPASVASSTFFVSYRDLFEHLELARHQRDNDQLQSILTSRKAKLAACLQPFPSALDSGLDSSSAAPKTIKLSDGTTHALSEEQQDLCRQIAQRYDLSHEDAFIQLQTFVIAEERELDGLSAAKSAADDSSSPAATASPAKNMTPRRRGAASRPVRLTGTAHASKISAADATADLLDAFNVFYFEERMYLLRTISSLIRITEDAQHEYFALANTVLALFADESFALRCLDHFSTLVDLPLSESIRQQPRYSSLWTKQVLREQFGLLEIVFLLFYGRLSPSPDAVLAFLSTLHHTQVGRRQANLGFLDEEASETVVCIGHVLILTGVEMLGLEEVMDGLDLSVSDEKRIFHDPVKLGQALDLLETTAADPMQSPILLAWALVLHRLEDALVAQHEQVEHNVNDEYSGQLDHQPQLPSHLAQLVDVVRTQDGGPAVWRRLAQAAFAPELQLFEVLASTLASPLLTSSNGASTPAVAGPSALAYRAVFKGLLLTITELVKPEFLPNFDALVHLWEAAFGSGIALELSPSAIDGVAALCDQFWQIDSRYESRCTTLDTARRRWPVSFRPLVRLMRALSGHARVDALASWPSLLDEKPRSEVEERACAAVFEFLANLPTYAQVLPMGANAPGAPFETMEGGDYTSVTYRVNRSIRIPGTQVRLAPGTTGSTISELGKAPVIVLWSPARPISAWKLMRDVLCCFPPPLPSQQISAESDAKVFDDDPITMDFERLAPAETGVAWEDLASEMLDLFASIVSASPDLAWTLLGHLEGRDLAADDLSVDYEPEVLEHIQQEKQELARAKNLSVISLSLLSHALVASPISTRLVQSAYKLLTVLLPYESEAVWQELRSSNVLIGSPGALPYVASSAARASSSSVLLAHEVSRASFDGLIALLDFHIGLFYDLRRSYSTWSVEALEVKAAVLTRSLGWVFECIWPEYQSWRYTRLADRIEIGQKCTQLLEIVLSERSWRTAQIPRSDMSGERGPAAGLVEAVERSLVSQPSMLGLAPIITCIGNGEQLLEQLNRAGRIADVVLAEQWISDSLRLAYLIVMRKRELTSVALRKLASLPAETAKKAVAARIDLGLFERLFFDHTIVASRATYGVARKSGRIELANAIFALVLLPTSTRINSEASRLLTAILRSVADLSTVGRQIPGLVGHLGTLAELEATLAGLVDLVGNPRLDPALRTDVWTMLAALVDTQPALGTLLLTGRHLAKSTESRLNSSANKDEGHSKSTTVGNGKQPEYLAPSWALGQALASTALDVAAAGIQNWRAVFEEDARLLEAILRFLDVSWAHAAEHVAAFDTIRARSAFFQALADLISESASAPSTDAQGFVNEQRNSRTLAHDQVASYAYRRMCQARALRLLERDIQLGSLLKDAGSKSSASKASLEAFLGILKSSDRLLQAIESSFTMSCDPSLRNMLEIKLAELYPTIDLDSLRQPARKDDFDTERRYGDNYYHSMDSFRLKVEGLLGTMTQDEIQEAGTVDEALLSVATINLEWSCIDVQNSLLQAWDQCVESVMGRVVTEAIATKQTFALEKSAITAWTRLAIVAADEGREGDFMRAAHATRMSLLSTLMELAWGHGESEGASTQDQIVQAASACGRLLAHSVFSVEDSLKGALPPPFHRDVFEMVLIGMVRIRSLLRADKALLRANDKTIEHHRALHSSVDLFCRHTLQALRIAMENAMRCLQSGQTSTTDETANTLEDELNMLVSIFEMTTRRDMGADVGVWLPHMQELQLLQITLDLLARAPVVRLDKPNSDSFFVQLGSFAAASSNAEHSRSPSMTHRILFMEPLLSMLLAIASQPVSGEELALQGAVNALTSNMLSEYLEEGKIGALLLSGDASPSHGCWTTMLRIVVELIDNLGGGGDVGNWSGASGRFVETDVQGFVRVFLKQIDRSLSLATIHQRLSSITGGFGPSSMRGADERMEPMAVDGSNGSSAVDSLLSLGQLDELEMVARLFYSLSRAENEAGSSSVGGSTGAASSMTSHLARRSTWALQPLVHLLQHPRELSGLLGWDGATGQDDSAEAQRMATDKIGEIVSVLISALWIHTRCATVLCGEATMWPSTQSGCAVIRPTTRTSAARSATLGTLLDLASYLSDRLRSSNGATKSNSGTDMERQRERDAGVLEQCLGLTAAQTAMWANGRSREGEESTQMEQMARQEIESGISRDLLASLRTAQEVVDTDSINLLSIIKKFVEAKLVPL